jgi:hypothetical protein
MKMKKTAMVGPAFVFLLVAAGIAQTGSGTVCVASRNDDPWFKVPPPEATSSRGLHLRVDKRTPVPWPQKESLKIDALDLSDLHLVAVLDSHNKPIESIKFRLSTYKSADLCMSYDGYQGVQLQEATKHTPWCKCK